MDIELIKLAAEAALVSWGNPIVAAVAAFFIFLLLSSISRAAGRYGPAFDTPRAKTLRQAALAQQAQLDARERRRHPQHSRIIFLSGELERRWWCYKFSVSSDTLQAAVRHAGPMVDDVERYLGS